MKKEKYYMPMWEIVLELLDNLTDYILNAKKNRSIAAIRNKQYCVKIARCLASRLTNQDTLIRDLEIFRLKMIL